MFEAALAAPCNRFLRRRGGRGSFPPRSPARRLGGTRPPGAWRIGATARHIPMLGPPLPARAATRCVQVPTHVRALTQSAAVCADSSGPCRQHPARRRGGVVVTGVRMVFYPAMAGPQTMTQRYRAREAAGIATFKVRDSRSRGICPSGHSAKGRCACLPPPIAQRDAQAERGDSVGSR